MPATETTSLARCAENGGEKNMVLRDTATCRPLAGPPAALLLSLLPPSPSAGSPSLAFSLLLNLRTTMAPIDILTTLFHQTMYAQNSSISNFRREWRAKMYAAVFTVCEAWTRNIPYDFRDDEMVRRLRELLDLCAVDEADRLRGDALLAMVACSLEKLARYERALASLTSSACSTSTSSTATTSSTTSSTGGNHSSSSTEQMTGLFALCADSVVVAQQLTHIELERFSMIGPDEIVYALMRNDISKIGQDELSGGVFSYLAWFKRLTNLVASEVLVHHRKRHRAAAIMAWVDVARAAMDGGNFNSTMAIVAGLALPAVVRLRRTWARVDKSKLEILQHQLDPSGNFVSYRSTMKAAVWRAEGAEEQSDKVIIPFFILLLKDLFFIFHSKEREFPNGHLNVQAFDTLAEQVATVVEWKSRTSSAPRLAPLLQYLLVATAHDERTLMQRSFAVEEPENAAEKEAAKQLRA